MDVMRNAYIFRCEEVNVQTQIRSRDIDFGISGDKK